MKTTAKKLLSVLLALCILSTLAVSAFAEVKTFPNYLMIGDSIAVYNGEPSSSVRSIIYSTYDKNPFQALPGTYSERLKNDPDLGIKQICTCAHPGWRVQEALYALGGPDYTTDYIMRYGGDKTSRIAYFSPTYRQALIDSDLISINLGSNNIMQSFVYGLYTAFEMQGIEFEGSEQDKQLLEAINRLKADAGDTEALITVINLLETTERGTVLLKNALNMLPEAVQGFKNSWDELMELIYELNPDANVLVLGMYNPIDDLVKFTVNDKLDPSEVGQKLTSGAAWLLKSMADPVVCAMDLYLRCGTAYARRYVYVDVSDVDQTGSKDGVHLGDVGNQYFYTQMKSAILANFVPESLPSVPTTPTGLLGRLFGALFNK